MQSRLYHRRENHRSPREDGQALTEFALSVPLLIALLIAVVAVAWIGFVLLSITSASRMGARHMSTYYDVPQDPERFATADAEITYVVTTSMPFLDWTRAEVYLWPEDVHDRVSGVQISVEVTYPLNWPSITVPYVLAEGALVLPPPLTLNSLSSMRLD